MNLNENSSADQPSSSDICNIAMNEIATMLIEPMQDKLTAEQDAILALIGISFKIMAEKATALEKMEQGFQGSFRNENDFNRN